MATEHAEPDPIKSSVVIGAIAGEDVRTATDNEHKMSLLESFRLYPAAAGWSLFFSMGVIMTAFDPQLLTSLYAVPAFQKDFGYLYEGSNSNSDYIVSAPWQTGLSMGNPIGQGQPSFCLLFYTHFLSLFSRLTSWTDSCWRVVRGIPHGMVRA